MVGNENHSLRLYFVHKNLLSSHLFSLFPKSIGHISFPININIEYCCVVIDQTYYLGYISVVAFGHVKASIWYIGVLFLYFYLYIADRDFRSVYMELFEAKEGD